MTHDVFVSHSSKDKPMADAVVAALEGRGIRCWIAPRDIVPGTDWSEAIIDGIVGSKVMLLVYSQHANESQQIKREVERAVSKGIPVIPLRIQDVPMAKGLEYFLSMPHWIDALTPERQARLDYLAETVQLLLDRQQGKPPAPQQRPTTPAPRTGSRRPSTPLLVGAGLVAAAIVAAAILLARRDDVVEPPIDPEPARRGASGDEPSGGAGGPARGDAKPPAEAPALDPRFAGKWSATVQAAGVTTSHLMDVDEKGRFSWRARLEDTGTMQAGNGGILQSSRNYGTFPQAYAQVTPGVVRITGPAGSAEWRRVHGGGGGSPTFDASLVGTWESSTVDPDGFTWRSTLQMSPTGAYEFRSEMKDEGTLRASDGRYRAYSDTIRREREGTYVLDDADTIRMTTQGTTAVWKRRA